MPIAPDGKNADAMSDPGGGRGAKRVLWRFEHCGGTSEATKNGQAFPRNTKTGSTGKGFLP